MYFIGTRLWRAASEGLEFVNGKGPDAVFCIVADEACARHGLELLGKGSHLFGGQFNDIGVSRGPGKAASWGVARADPDALDANLGRDI
jgi:hypothetical protein